MTQDKEKTVSIPKVSILVPCYNVEKYLHQCIDSILAQTLKDIEIICINDGSKDSTLEILRDYAGRDSRISIIDKKNSGYGASMNMGLDKVSGEYVGIVESDDYIEPEMFEKMYNAAKKDDLDIVRCLFNEINELNGVRSLRNDEEWGAFRCGEIFKPLAQKSIFWMQPSIWAGIYRRSMIEDNGIRFLETPGASYQDTSFAFKVYACAKKMTVLPYALHNYRINENSSVASAGKIFCVCDEEAEIRRFAKAKGIFEKLKGVMAFRTFGCYKWNYKRLSYPCKRQFIRQWSKELRQQFAEGSITREYFSRGRYLRMWLVANCPNLFYFSKQV